MRVFGKYEQCFLMTGSEDLLRQYVVGRTNTGTPAHALHSKYDLRLKR